jgi:hypothetical protein
MAQIEHILLQQNLACINEMQTPLAETVLVFCPLL